ncbi:MAG TPA: hypothetical protein PKE55_13865 [Kiritimatiellia bacterium]|nr:hypothetical protein [Kiritimatiellia bacterium]
MSLRIFHLPQPLPSDAVARFAEHAAPPISTLGAGQIHGWVTGRHLLDRNITDDTALYAGFLRLSLLQAERKIPEPLLRAECKMEEIALQQAKGKERLSARERSEIKKSIVERLLPTMPPQLKGISLVAAPGTSALYASALSDKQIDAFVVGVSHPLGIQPIPVTPEVASLLHGQYNTHDWSPASFTPELENEHAGQLPGEDFLTWLLFLTEARGGIMTIDGLGKIALMIDGPFLLAREGSGAHEAVLRKGEPRLGAETKTALLSGKKLRRAKLTLATSDEHQWSVTIDHTFAFRSLKLPEGEKLDPASKFQERMFFLDQFREAFFILYQSFCKERSTPATWSATLEEMRAWITSRTARS